MALTRFNVQNGLSVGTGSIGVIDSEGNGTLKNLTASGDLTVLGDRTYISSSTVELASNFINLNISSNPSVYGGIYFRDVNSSQIGSLIWDSYTNQWLQGLKGSEQAFPMGVGTVNALVKWNGFTSLSSSVIFDDGVNVGIGTNVPTDKLTVFGGGMSLSGSIKFGSGDVYDLGTSDKKLRTVYSNFLTGSLTQLANGEPYLVAGPNMIVTTGSNGSVVLEATLAAGTVSGNGTIGYVPKFTSPSAITSGIIYDGGSFIGIGVTDSSDILAVSGSVSITGSLNPGEDDLYDLGSSTSRWSNLYARSVTGQLTGSNLARGSVLFSNASGGISGSQSTLYWDSSNSRLGIGTSNPSRTLTVFGDASVVGDLIITGQVLPIFNKTFDLGEPTRVWKTVYAETLSGSLTTLSNGSPYLISGPKISLSTGSSGAITIGYTGITSVSTTSGLTGGGSTGAITLGIDPTVVALVGGTTFTGVTKHNAGLSGSLTRLTSGDPYIVAKGNVVVTTGSSGEITIETINSGTIHGVNAGLGLLGGGSSGTVSVAINDGIVATLTGSTFTGAVKFNAGLSGSLTTLTNGDPFIVAGSNITIVTGSNGSITISGESGGTVSGDGDPNYLTKWSPGNVLTGSKIYDDDTRVRISVPVDVTGSLLPGENSQFNLGSVTSRWNTVYSDAFSGSLTRLSTGDPYLLAGTGISLSTGSAGSVTISSTAVTSPAGSNSQVQFNNNGAFGANPGFTYNSSTNTLNVNNLSGSLTKLSSGSDYLVAGTGISLSTGSSGAITITSTAITSPAGSDSQVQFNSGGNFSADSNFTYNSTTKTLKVNNLSGSLTKLSTGADYLVAGTGITLSTGSNGSITITGNVGTLTNVTSGIGLKGSTSGGTVNLSIDDGIVATITGSTFTGAVNFNAGLSGSLTRLTNGDAYIVGGSNVTVTTGSNGNIVIDVVGGSGGLVDGFGLTNYSTRWQDTNTLTYGTIYDDGQNIGVGTASGGDRLSVSGSASVTGSLLPGFDLVYNLGSPDKRWNVYAANISGSLTGSGLLNGSILFASSGGVLTGSNSSLFWDRSLERLGVGTSSPTSIFTVLGPSHFTGSLIPGLNNTHDLGETIKSWRNIYSNNVYSSGVVSGTLVGSGLVQGSLPFVGSGGTLIQNNPKLFWDNSNSRLGVGTNDPSMTFEVYGTAGSLFSVIDTLSGSLLSVSGISGIPIFEVFSDNKVVAGGLNSNALVVSNSVVGMGTENAAGRLHVLGTSSASTPVTIIQAGVSSPTAKVLDIRNSSGVSVASIDYLGNISGSLGSFGSSISVVSGTFSGDVTIAGDLTVNGGNTRLNTQTLTVRDNIVVLNASSSPSSTGGLYVNDTTVNTTGSLIWDSSIDRWRAGLLGSEVNLVTPSSTDSLFNKTLTLSGSTRNYVTGGLPNTVLFFDATGSLSASNNFSYTSSTGALTVGSLSSSANILAGGGITLGGGIVSAGGGITLGGGGGIVATGGITVTGSVLIGGDNTYDVGSNDKKFRTVYANSLTGSLTTLADGTSYLVAGANVIIQTGSNGSVIITAQSSGGSGGGAAVGGSGTTNFIPKWSNAIDLSDSNLYDNGSSVSIGMGAFATADKFSVLGRVSITGSLEPGQNDTYSLGSNTKKWARLYTDDAYVSGTLYSSGSLLVSSSVGIGTMIPAGFLHVSSDQSGSLLIVTNDSTGSVGIGTTQPRARLQVVGNTVGTVPAAIIRAGVSSPTAPVLDIQTNTGTSVFTVSGSGNVGIGTAVITYALDVWPSTATSRIGQGLIGTWPNNTTFAMFGHSSLSHVAAGNYALLQNNVGDTYLNAASTKTVYFRNANTDVAAINATGVGIGTTNPGFSLQLGNNSVSSTATPQTINMGGTISSTAGSNAKVRVYHDGTNTYGFGASVNQLDYIVSSSASHVWYVGATEYVRVNSTGVGLGTNNPSFRLQLGSNTSSSTTTPETISMGGTFSSTPGANMKLRVYWDGSGAYGLGASSSALDYGVPNAGSHIWYTGGTERARLNSSGVGIGTNNPASRLHVRGSASTTTPIAIIQESSTLTNNTKILDVQNSVGNSYFSVTSGSSYFSSSIGIGTTQPAGVIHASSLNNSGSLFLITDTVSGSLFSVNNVTGLPILEVFSDNRVILGRYGQNALCVAGSRVGVGAVPTNDIELLISGSSTSSDRTVVIRAGIPSPTGNLLDVQNSSSTSVFWVNAAGVGFFSGSLRTPALTGSLTRLNDGTPYILAGTNITITTGSNGAITISGSSGAGIIAGSNTQVQFNDGGVFGASSGFTFNKTTSTLTATNISGSLTKLSNGSDYLVPGSGISLSTGSNGSITISSTSITSPGGTNTQVQFNDGGSFGGDSDLTFNKTTGALTGTYVVASTGFSGSLTKLASGGDYLIGGSGINLSTGSNGSITITSTAITSPAGANTQIQFNDGGSFGGDSNLTFNKVTDTLTVKNLAGSLTTLSDGTPYLFAGSNVVLTTGSNGSITINAAILPYTTASFTNVTSITVNHNLGISLYDIEVFDSSYNKIFPRSVTATSDTQADITFGLPTSGYVIVGGSGGGGGGGGGAQTDPVYASFTNDVTLDKTSWTVVSSGSNYLRTTDIATTGRAVFVNANMTFYSNDPTTIFSFTFARSADAGSTWSNVVDSTSIASSTGKLQTISVGNVATNIIPVNMSYFDSSLIGNSGNYRYAVYYKSNSGTGSLGLGSELSMISAYEV